MRLACFYLNIRFMVCASFFLTALTQNALGMKVLGNSLEVPFECEKSYEVGFQAYVDLLKDPNFDGSKLVLKEKLDVLVKSDERCDTYILAGAFDAQSIAQERIFTEYLFEFDTMTVANWPNERKSVIKELYTERFRQVGLEEQTLNQVEATWEPKLHRATDQMKASLKHHAIENAQAIPLGRFVFVSGDKDSIEPYTLLEYAFDESNQLLRAEDGGLAYASGTYQQEAQLLLNSAVNNANEYMKWNPPMFFGSDSSFSALFYKREDSGKARKEKAFFDRSSAILARAIELHLDSKPFLNMLVAMNKKSRASLEAELASLEAMRKWVLIEMPLFFVSWIGVKGALVGIGKSIYGLHNATRKFGWALSAGRILATPAKASTIRLGIGLSAFGASIGQGIYEFYRDVTDEKTPFEMGHFFSYMACASFRGVSYVTFVNTIIMGSNFIAESAFLGGRAILLTQKELWTFIGRNGAIGALRQTPKITYDSVKWLLSEWGKDTIGRIKFVWAYRVADKTKVAIFRLPNIPLNKNFVYNASKEAFFNIGFEASSRYLVAQASNDKTINLFWTDESGLHANSKGMVNLVGGLFMGTFFRPFDNIGGKHDRFNPTRIVAWRTAGVATDTMAWLMGGYTNARYLYEVSWSFTVGPRVSEKILDFRNGLKDGRGILNSIQSIAPGDQKSFKNFVVDIALQSALKLPSRFAKVYILEHFIDSKTPTMEEVKVLRDFLLREVNPRFEIFSKEELADGVLRMRDYYRTEEGRAFLKKLIEEGNP